MRGCGRPEIESTIGTTVKCHAKIFRHLHVKAIASGVDGTPQKPQERRQTISKDFTDCLSIQSLSK